MVALLACILGVVSLWFVLALLTSIWRAVDACVQGVPRGLQLTWRLFRTILRGIRAVEKAALRLDTWLGQHAHAAYWTWSYCLKRSYIASRLWALRRERHV